MLDEVVVWVVPITLRPLFAVIVDFNLVGVWDVYNREGARVLGGQLVDGNMNGDHHLLPNLLVVGGGRVGVGVHFLVSLEIVEAILQLGEGILGVSGGGCCLWL